MTAYETVIGSIIHETLYHVYSAKNVNERLNNFLEENKDKIENEAPVKDQDRIDIRDYVQDYSLGKEDTYIIYVDKLYRLRNFFKVCHENNLNVLSEH